MIVPKWFETKLFQNGIMREVDVDSHDGMNEYAFYSNDSFEIYELGPHQKILETNCKVRTTNLTLEKQFSAKIPIYLVQDIKIGELELDDYVANKSFYGTNLTYEMVGLASSEMSLALK